jgi:uncharacterized protein (DUF488 family)
VTLYTLGHSTRPIDEFLALCHAHGLRRVVDVRRFPASRRNPQFGREALAASLAAADVEYLWRPALGGRRSRPKDAPPSAWRVPAFAAYADYMNTPEFREAIAEVLTLAASALTAIMCAEAFAYQCHRRLISDWVELHGGEVVHLLDARRREGHHVTPFARRAGDRVVYETDAQLSLPV